MRQDSQKVIFGVSRDLLKRLDETAAQLFMSRSEFIRQALREKIERVERERLAADIREGYQTNAAYYATALSRFSP